MKKLWLLLMLGACSRPTAEVPSGFSGNDLAKKVIALHEIISLEEVARFAGVEVSKIGIHYEDYSPYPAQHSVQYHWPTGQTVSLPGGNSIDEYHSAGIAFVESMTAEEFRSSYGTNAGLQKRVNELGKDSSLTAEAAIAETRYLADYAKIRKLESLSAVGEIAFWETPVQALHVFADGVTFTVTINTGENEKVNRDKAIKIAGIILSRS